MTQITIDLDEESNRNIEIYKAKNSLRNKADAVKSVVREYFGLVKHNGKNKRN